MPTPQDIKQLRKSGRLMDAYKMAIDAQEESPQNRSLQNEFGWVLYDQLKLATKEYGAQKITRDQLIETLERVTQEYNGLDCLIRTDLLHSMFTSQQITALRKSAQIEKAYETAVIAERDHPHDKNIQGALGWVLHDQLKLAVKELDDQDITQDQFIVRLKRLTDDYRRLDSLVRPDLLHSMFTAQQITALKKSGQIEKAYEIAVTADRDNPQDKNIQGALGWLLYEQLKKDVEDFTLDKIIVGKLVNSINRIVGEYRQLDTLNKPDALHSQILRLLLKAKVADKWEGLVVFLHWWGLDNFMRDDCLPYKPDDGGKAIASLKLRTFYAVGKALNFGRVNDEDLKIWAVAVIDKALSDYPDDIWLNYHKAKWLLQNDKTEDALHFLMPVVVRNTHSGWVWGLLGGCRT